MPPPNYCHPPSSPNINDSNLLMRCLSTLGRLRTAPPVNESFTCPSFQSIEHLPRSLGAHSHVPSSPSCHVPIHTLEQRSPRRAHHNRARRPPAHGAPAKPLARAACQDGAIGGAIGDQAVRVAGKQGARTDGDRIEGAGRKEGEGRVLLILSRPGLG